MARIGVRSADFTWVHRVLVLLRERGHRPCHLESGEDVPHDVKVVLTTVHEAEDGATCLRADHLEADLAKALRGSVEGTRQGRGRYRSGATPGRGVVR
ncbi:MAG: hypothetical protein ACPHCZ_03455 [Candidatus Poseidoniaceae archaeon]